MDNYYKILGVPLNSSKEDVKRAYRLLAKKYHPDANAGSKEYEELFKKISEAYDVLNDDGKRKEYNAKLLRNQAQNNSRNFAYRNSNYRRPATQNQDTKSAGEEKKQNQSSTGDNERFDYRKNNERDRAQTRNNSEKGDTTKKDFNRNSNDFKGSPNDTHINKEKFESKRTFNPKNRNFDRNSTNRTGNQPRGQENFFEREDYLAGNSQGSFLSRIFTNIFKKGEREISMNDISVTLEVTLLEALRGFKREIPLKRDIGCESCKDKAATEVATCPVCSGKKYLNKEEDVKISVEPVLDLRKGIRILKLGNFNKITEKTGDLVVFLKLKEEKWLKFHEGNLFANLPVSFSRALKGGIIEIPLFNQKFDLYIEPGTTSGKIVKIQGRNLPQTISFPRGALFLRLFVEVPVNLTPEQKILLEKFLVTEESKNYPKVREFYEKIH